MPITALALTALLAFAPQTTEVRQAPLPMVTGPIAGPGPMWTALTRNSMTGQVPPLPKGTSLEDFDYETKEYFVSGTAAGKPYKTRIAVHYPRNSRRFSGIVVSEAMHGSGVAWMFFNTRVYLMRAGHIHVEIAAQKAPTEEHVIASNRERYGTLSIPDAAQTGEILAQAGTLIKSRLKDGPLSGFNVRKSLLMGTSNTSAVLRAYLDLHSVYRMADKSPIFDGYYATSTGGNNPITRVDVPLIHVATMNEVVGGAANGNRYRRPDGDAAGDQYRLYEVAGMPHNDSRENPTYRPAPCDMPMTQFPAAAFFSLGLQHMVQWVDKGVAPPRAERIEIDGNTANDGSPLALDEHGNAKGGVRSPYVDVPAAKYGAPNKAQPKPGTRVDFYCNIAGYEERFPAEKLKAIHGSRRTYQRKVADRLKQLLRDRWFLPEYAKEVENDAAKMAF